MPLSLPEIQPQPTDPTYGLDVLNLFETYDTPAEYQNYFGTAAPPYSNVMGQIKQWKDDSKADLPANEIVTYTVLATEVNPENGVAQFILPLTFVNLTMMAAEAARVNIWAGPPTYAVWAPTTPATIEDSNGGFVSNVEVNLLSELAQAIKLNAELGGSGVTEYIMAPGNSGLHINYHGDTKRYWIFTDSNGQEQIAGMLLVQQWAMTENQNVFTGGFEYPGHWENINKTWTWVPNPQPSGPAPNTSIVPMPVRKLYSVDNPPPAGGGYESFTEPLIGQPLIQRTF